MPTNTDQPTRTSAPGLDAMMREVRHTLGNIDFAHAVDLDALGKCALDPDWKQSLEAEISAAHRQKRQPYVDLLTRLRRQQHRQSFVA